MYPGGNVRLWISALQYRVGATYVVAGAIGWLALGLLQIDDFFLLMKRFGICEKPNTSQSKKKK